MLYLHSKDKTSFIFKGGIRQLMLEVFTFENGIRQFAAVTPLKASTNAFSNKEHTPPLSPISIQSLES